MLVDGAQANDDRACKSNTAQAHQRQASAIAQNGRRRFSASFQRGSGVRGVEPGQTHSIIKGRRSRKPFTSAGRRAAVPFGSPAAPHYDLQLSGCRMHPPLARGRRLSAARGWTPSWNAAALLAWKMSLLGSVVSPTCLRLSLVSHAGSSCMSPCLLR